VDSEPSEVADPWQRETPRFAASAGSGGTGVWDIGTPTPTSAPAEEVKRTEQPPERPSGGSRRWRWVVEWAMVLAVALAVALVVRAFVIQTFFIPSQSMEPTLMVGDRILVDKLSYHLHAVHRGDIIVFGRPPGEPASSNIQDLVKRVVGLPQETIWSSNGNVYVQGPDTGNKAVLVPEPVPGTQLGPPIRRTVIPANEFYVLGDNRTDSDDSRYFGLVPRSDIVGRVVMRIWPVSSLRFF